MTDPLETRASLIHGLPDPANVGAWDEFVTIYAPLVYRLARRRGLQPADADDLVQEVLAAVSRSVEDWLERPDRGRFRAWLFGIARNTAINFLTRPRHRPLAAGGGDALKLLAESLTADDTSDSFDVAYEREVFRWASVQVREGVADKTWRAFWETTMENRAITDVAKELDMSTGSIYIARSRVMARLRELVRALEEGES